jgi:hypothetical protein
VNATGGVGEAAVLAGSPSHTRRSLGRLRGPGRVPLDYVARQRRSLLPEVVERGDEFAVEVARARRLAEQVPLDARDKGSPREVARPYDHDPTRRIRNPPRLRMKRIGWAAKVFEFREPGLERPAGDIHPPQQLSQGLGRRDAEVIAHEEAHAGPGSDRTEEPRPDDVESRSLHERREQIDFACSR